MLMALSAGPARAQDFLEGFSGGDPLESLLSGNPYDVLRDGVFATEDGCGNLSRFFGIEEHPPYFLVYSSKPRSLVNACGSRTSCTTSSPIG